MTENEQKKDTKFKLGNSAWKNRETHGRSKIFNSPQELWEAACDYFQEVEDNPIIKTELVKYQGAATKVEYEHPRPMSVGAFCLSVPMDFSTWQEYQKRTDFTEVTSRIELIIKTQKLEGAIVDL